MFPSKRELEVDVLRSYDIRNNISSFLWISIFWFDAFSTYLKSSKDLFIDQNFVPSKITKTKAIDSKPKCFCKVFLSNNFNLSNSRLQKRNANCKIHCGVLSKTVSRIWIEFFNFKICLRSSFRLSNSVQILLYSIGFCKLEETNCCLWSVSVTLTLLTFL